MHIHRGEQLLRVNTKWLEHLPLRKSPLDCGSQRWQVIILSGYESASLVCSDQAIHTLDLILLTLPSDTYWTLYCCPTPCTPLPVYLILFLSQFVCQPDIQPDSQSARSNCRSIISRIADESRRCESTPEPGRILAGTEEGCEQGSQTGESSPTHATAVVCCNVLYCDVVWCAVLCCAVPC